MRSTRCSPLMLSVALIACGGGSNETETPTSGPPESAGGIEPAPPSAPMADADEDGVADDLDRCPTEPASPVSGGCPDYDEDEDGEPEHWSRYACTAGSCVQEVCHREPPAIPSVYFANGRAATGSRTSTAAMDAMADVLREHDEEDVFVTGHTADNEGEALAQDRAEWLVAQLVRRGIDEARLIPAGFGAHWGKSEIPEGMSESAASRRVELHVTWYGPPGCEEHAVPADKCPVVCTGG